jgi:hypothetical protein
MKVFIACERKGCQIAVNREVIEEAGFVIVRHEGERFAFCGWTCLMVAAAERPDDSIDLETEDDDEDESEEDSDG